jgi:Protein of unknown function (DUF2924)
MSSRRIASARMDKGEPAMRKASHPEMDRGALSGTPRASMLAPRGSGPGSSGGVAEADVGRSLEIEIVEIQHLSLEDLRIRWRNLTGRLAPRYLSRTLLARIMAYRVQAQSFGDLDRNTARVLERWGKEAGRQRSVQPAMQIETGASDAVATTTERRVSAPLVLKPGTLLTREWQGRMETAMVVADGFAWNGEMFESLSAVAPAITGTKWNGHRFFGVRPRDRAPRGPGEAGAPPLRFAKGLTEARRPNGATP